MVFIKMRVCHQDGLFYPSSDEWPLQTHGASPPRNNRFSSLLGCWVFANQDQSGVSTFPAKTSLLKLRHRVVQVRLRALPRNSSNWLWYGLTHTHNTRFDGGGAGSQETGAHFLMFFFTLRFFDYLCGAGFRWWHIKWRAEGVAWLGPAPEQLCWRVATHWHSQSCFLPFYRDLHNTNNGEKNLDPNINMLKEFLLLFI